MNHYEKLGIDRDADEQQIKKAYRKAAKKHHPDLNPDDPNATAKFKEIQNAYDVLKDFFKKTVYDRSLGPYKAKNKNKPKKETPERSSGVSFEKVEEEFFGGTKFRGRSIKVKIEIELKEVLTGCKKYIKIKKSKPCFVCQGSGEMSFRICTVCRGDGSLKTWDMPNERYHTCQSCKGTGKYDVVKCEECKGNTLIPEILEEEIEVNIPVGIENGHQIRFPGKGELSTRRSGEYGDVVVFIFVKEDSFFKVDKLDILLEVPVSYSQLVLGDEIEIPTLTGELVKITIPVGSQSHTKFRLKGRGIPSIREHKRGDLVAVLKVETPKELDEEYKDLFKKLTELEKKNITDRIKLFQRFKNGYK